MTDGKQVVSQEKTTDELIVPPAFPKTAVPRRLFSEPGTIFTAVALFPNIWLGFKSYMNGGMIRSHVGIGRYCSIGRNVIIAPAMHPMDWATTHPIAFDPRFRTTEPPETQPKRTFIGHDVWIGDNVVIMPGVKVGNGAVIGTSAVVTKNVAPYSIVAGVPARHIRFRFPPEVVRALNTSQWWMLHPRHLVGLPFEQVDAFVRILRDNQSTFDTLPIVYREITT